MLPTEVKDVIEKWGGRIRNTSSVGGGCISEAVRVELEDGKSLFVKYGSKTSTMFKREANGLREIEKAKCIHVPRVLSVGENFLVLEFLESETKCDRFWSVFGQALAKMHGFLGEAYGFYEDNFIGLSHQKNTPLIEYKRGSNAWCEFYFEYRLLYQLKLAEKNGYATDELKSLFHKLEGAIGRVFEGVDEPPSLLHGDLWSGNYVIGSGGQPYIIDPAVYYGHREADLAMTKLFGGYPAEFYEAYQKEKPLLEGWEYREGLYKLYHVLNHLNLFGRSYYGQAIDILRSYV